MTQLYLLSAPQAHALPQTFAGAWFPERLLRAARMPPDAGALCLAAGALTAGVLHLHDRDIHAGPYGKPEAPGVFFSLSHSGEYALLAVSDADVGADLERLRPAPMRTAGRVFAPEELDWLAAGEDGDARFFTLWTLKEALLKAAGRGLTQPLREVNVLPLLRGQAAATPEGAFFGHTQLFDGYCLSVCTRSAAPPSAPRRLTAADILRKTITGGSE